MYFDAHTHTQLDAFKNDSVVVVKRALAANVWMINVGTDLDASKRAVQAAHAYPEGVFASVGLHPTDSIRKDGIGEVFDPAAYRTLAEDPKTVAIGECGLDYFRLTEATKKNQRDVFLAQIALAREVEKPLMIHCRDAFHDLVPILRDHQSELNEIPGVIHFFTGTKENMKDLLELGFAFTFGGVVTFTRDYDEVVRYAPLDWLLSETDAPYVAPMPYRGKRNEPVYVIETVKKLAELRGISSEEMEAVIFANAKRIFRFA